MEIAATNDDGSYISDDSGSSDDSSDDVSDDSSDDSSDVSSDVSSFGDNDDSDLSIVYNLIDVIRIHYVNKRVPSDNNNDDNDDNDDGDDDDL